jgi:hypothetical protein
MSEWNFVLQVIDPVTWVPEAEAIKVNPIRIIRVRVIDRWVPWNSNEFDADGHRIGIEWRGPDDEKETYEKFVTADAFDNGPWTFWKVPVGHGWQVWFSVDELNEDLGDPTFGLSPQCLKPGEKPKFHGTLRVSVLNEDGAVYHVRCDGSHTIKGRMVPVESLRKMPTAQQITELANTIRQAIKDEAQHDQ